MSFNLSFVEVGAYPNISKTAELYYYLIGLSAKKKLDNSTEPIWMKMENPHETCFLHSHILTNSQLSKRVKRTVPKIKCNISTTDSDSIDPFTGGGENYETWLLHPPRDGCNKRAVLGLLANFLNIVIRKKQKNKFFTLKEIFQVWNSFNWKQFWTNLKKIWNTALFSLFKEIKGDYKGLKTVQKV